MSVRSIFYFNNHYPPPPSFKLKKINQILFLGKTMGHKMPEKSFISQYCGQIIFSEGKIEYVFKFSLGCLIFNSFPPLLKIAYVHFDYSKDMKILLDNFNNKIFSPVKKKAKTAIRDVFSDNQKYSCLDTPCCTKDA